MKVQASNHNYTPEPQKPIEQVQVAEPQVQAVEPKVEVAEPKVEVKVEAEPFNPSKWLEEKTGGKIKAEEELLTFVNKYGEVDVTSLQEKASKVDDLEARYKEAEPANEFVKELNKLLKNGASQDQVLEFYQLSQVDLSTLSPKEAEILRLQKEKGLSKEDAIFKVERLLDADRLEEEVVRLNEIELKTRFKENVEYLKQYRKELSVTEAQKQAQEKEATKQQYFQSVDSAVPTLSKELTSLSVSDISGDKDNPIPFEYVLPDSFKKEANQTLKNVIVSNRFDVNNTDHMEQAKEIAKSIAIASDPERYVRAAIKHYQSVISEREASKGAKDVRQSQAVNVSQPSSLQRPRVVWKQPQKN
jgi:hypothetical protein